MALSRTVGRTVSVNQGAVHEVGSTSASTVTSTTSRGVTSLGSFVECGAAHERRVPDNIQEEGSGSATNTDNSSTSGNGNLTSSRNISNSISQSKVLAAEHHFRIRRFKERRARNATQLLNLDLLGSSMNLFADMSQGLDNLGVKLLGFQRDTLKFAGLLLLEPSHDLLDSLGSDGGILPEICLKDVALLWFSLNGSKEVGEGNHRTAIRVVTKEERTSASREFLLNGQCFLLDESFVFIDHFVNDGLCSICTPEAGVFGILLGQSTLLRTNEALEHMDIHQTLDLPYGDCKSLSVPVFDVISFLGPVSSLSVVVVSCHDIPVVGQFIAEELILHFDDLGFLEEWVSHVASLTKFRLPSFNLGAILRSGQGNTDARVSAVCLEYIDTIAFDKLGSIWESVESRETSQSIDFQQSTTSQS
ncbi:hypothetical protein HG531_011586 [Fusarium graminearum]|nr:hypothetical protein HG531_011586 [Fusarium graminearum]